MPIVINIDETMISNGNKKYIPNNFINGIAITLDKPITDLIIELIIKDRIGAKRKDDVKAMNEENIFSIR